MTPDSKLPWKEVLNKRKDKYQLYAADNLTCVVENVYNLGDALFIEEACNNYAEAIKILNNVINYNNSLKPTYQISESLILDIETFLKSIE